MKAEQTTAHGGLSKAAQNNRTARHLPRSLSLPVKLLVILGAALFISCVGPGIYRQTEVVRLDIEKARKSGAYTCASRELALAETHVDFTETELQQGNFLRAQQHIDVAVENVKLALANSKDCGPKRVLIKKNLDQDGDGILDKDDACPDRPEDYDGFADQDGCPDPDNDNDGVLDPLDRCVNEPEDKDLFEDADGCPDPDNDKDTVLDTVDGCPNTPGPVSNGGCPVEDRDGDGIADKDDACPDKPEDKDGDRDEDGCPDVDTDGDGLEDDVDQCPTQPEDNDGWQDEDGCPEVDNDGDGILDTIDLCPNEPGPLESKGCPDQDGDGIPDLEDRCPTEVGVAQPEEPERHGCPKKYKLIVIKKDKIEIKQQVQFDTGKATIRSASAALLAEVADAIRSSNLKLVRIEGHTDDVGSDDSNQRLSEARAQSVREWLIDREGLDGDILEARGFGESKPIASNRTKRGRQQNRRVEFNVDR
ncbi:MAG: OmpA family protein [Myxococcota bacterium]